MNRRHVRQFISYNQAIEKLNEEIDTIRKNRLKWCRDNKTDIKQSFPKNNKVYQIRDIKKVSKPYQWENLTDEVYYFKCQSNAFRPGNDFDYHCDVYPTVKGVLLDSNFKEVNAIFQETRVQVYHLIDIKDNPVKKSLSNTNVYVMIDKNTGFYKIGRSKHPLKREKTLQSEKPTIEMLFSCSGMIKDEKILHDKFAKQRIRGEWFDLKGSDINYIRNYFSNEQEK